MLAASPFGVKPGSSAVNPAASFFEQPPGRYVIKVFSRGLRTPFTGLTDAGGYFFIPLIPQGETFTAEAIDTLTGKRRTFQGIGPPKGQSVLMFFDFFSNDRGPGELPIHWVGGAGGGDNKNWDDPLNWDTKIVPKEFHDVFIDVPATITVTHRLGSDTINSLHSSANLLISGSSLSIAATSQISGALALKLGTLGGTGRITANGGLIIDGNATLNGAIISIGSIVWRSGTLAGSGILTNTGTLDINSATTRSLSGLTLANAGTITWGGAGTFQINNGSVLRNLASGLFDIQSDASMVYALGAVPSFVNLGIVRKSAGAGTSALSVPFSGGKVEVLTGTLNLSSNDTSTSGGDFTVASGAVLDLNGGAGAHTYTGSYTGTGAGTVRLRAATLVVGAAGASFNFSGNLFQWSGGTVSGPGILTNIGTLNINSTTHSLSGLTLANAGTITWGGAGTFQINNGSVLRNLASGLFDIQSDTSMVYALGAAPSFVNLGIVRKSAGAGTSALSVPFTNNGAVDAQSGTLNFGSSVVNNGQISMGAAARTMAITGSFTQAATGALNIKIGGLSAGTQFDQISIGGSATLDGTLNINLIGGFTPGAGDSFQVLNYGSHSGAFATINGNGPIYTPSYSATNLTLAAP